MVCIDCYRARINGQPASVPLSDGDLKDKDAFAWLFCNNNKSHQLDTLMLTQIIAGDALEEVNTKLKLLTKLRATNGTEKKLEIPDSGSSAATVFKDETDIKPEAPVVVDGEEVRSDSFSESFPSLSVTSLQAEDSSTLRDLLTYDQADEDCLLSWVDPDTDLKQMKLEETSKLFKSSHKYFLRRQSGSGPSL